MLFIINGEPAHTVAYMWRSEDKFWVSVLYTAASGAVILLAQVSCNWNLVQVLIQEIREGVSGQATIFLPRAWSFLVILSLFFIANRDLLILLPSNVFFSQKMRKWRQFKMDVSSVWKTSRRQWLRTILRSGARKKRKVVLVSAAECGKFKMEEISSY